MSDREKLIKLMKTIESHPEVTCPFPNDNCAGCRYYKIVENRCDITARKVDYLIQNGVTAPPFKVGDVVYPLNAEPRFRAVIERISITTEGMEFEWVQYDVGVDCTECWDCELFTIDDIGKTVFLTNAEYEKVLKEREANEGESNEG